jgi:glycosyltransferase involved in cell wall biosynthesis
LSVVVRSIGRPTLGRALASIATQRYPNVQIVIVAASGRDHPPIPERFGPCPVVAVRSACRLPRADAADAGLRAAEGDWITFLDDDDELLPGHLAGLTASAEEEPGKRAVNGRALATFRDGRTEVWGQRFALAELYQRNFVHLSTLLFHRSLRDAGVAFDRALPLHEDWDFVLQLAQHAQFANWPEPTFRWHADAGSSGGGGEANVDEEAFARHRDYVYAKWAVVRDAWLERCTVTMQEAAAHAMAGRSAEAAVTARAVLTFSQNDPHALNLLAMLALRRGDTTEALTCQTLAAEVRPHDADIRFNLAQVHLARGDLVRARATLTEALVLDPTHPAAVAALRNLGGTALPSTTPVRSTHRGLSRASPPTRGSDHETGSDGSVGRARARGALPHEYPSAGSPGARSSAVASDRPERRQRIPATAATRAGFLELERHCAANPADAEGRRSMLQLFLALGQPDDLPGASLTLPPGNREPRIAVLTPYLREPIRLLERCHRSVRGLTVRCEHILIADGFPRAELDTWPVRHLRLSKPSQNFGDTPRRIAGEAAMDGGFEAVIYLDADNWLRPRHVESLFACHLARGAAVCHSARTLHRVDETVMPLVQRGDNHEHVDTSCVLVATAAFDLLRIWGTWPRELSRIDDRMFWHAVVSRGHGANGFTGALTTCYEASHSGFYRALGEASPPGVRPDIDLDTLFRWHAELPSAEHDQLDGRWGFSVSALVAELRAMRS